MIYNSTFTTYRRETSSGKRQYSATPNISSADAFKEPVDGNLRSVLGLDNEMEAFWLMTEETDFQVNDKVVIGSETFFVSTVETSSYNGVERSRVLILTDYVE